jgi:hypothetical protein
MYAYKVGVNLQSLIYYLRPTILQLPNPDISKFH